MRCESKVDDVVVVDDDAPGKPTRVDRNVLHRADPKYAPGSSDVIVEDTVVNTAPEITKLSHT